MQEVTTFYYIYTIIGSVTLYDDIQFGKVNKTHISPDQKISFIVVVPVLCSHDV